MRDCPVCGARMPADASSCLYCGAALTPTVRQGVQQPDVRKGAHFGPAHAEDKSDEAVVQAEAHDAALHAEESTEGVARGRHASHRQPRRAHAEDADGTVDDDSAKDGLAGSERAAEDADREGRDGDDDLPPLESFFEHDAAVHPHGESKKWSRAKHVQARERVVLDETTRKRVKIGIIVGAVVIAIALVVVIAIALISELQLRDRAQAATQAEEAAEADAGGAALALPSAGWGGGFAASDGERLYWATDDGVYAASTLSADEAFEPELVVGDSASYLQVDDGTLRYVAGGTEVRSIGVADGASDPSGAATLYTCGSGECIEGFVVHDDRMYLAVTTEEGEGAEPDTSDGVAEGDEESATGVRVLSASVGDTDPQWAEAFAVEGVRAWLFDTGDQLALVSAEDGTWMLSQARFDALGSESGPSSSFQLVAQADEQLCSVFYDGSCMYKTVEGDDGSPVTSRQELSGSFSDYANLTGTPIMAGSPELCVMATDTGGVAWVESATGFLHDATADVTSADLDVSSQHTVFAVDGSTVWMLEDTGEGPGTLACIDCSEDPIAIMTFGA